MKTRAEPEQTLGDLLQAFVNRVSHRGGQTLGILNEASVTLHQVMLLSRVVELGGSTPSELAATLNMSLPSVSQMVDRLHQLKLITRSEMAEDRRRKRIVLTRKGETLLARLHEARSAEYELGTALLSDPLRADLKKLLERGLRELSAAAARRNEAA